MDFITINMYSLSKEANENYVCTIVEIKNLRKHKNADRLQVSTIQGSNVILGLDVKVGDKGVFFPVESQINESWLSKHNLFEDKERNHNKEVKGYFNSKGRVRALLLRTEKSEGFWVPVSQVPEVNEATNGTVFDTVNGELFVKKYTPPTNTPAGPKEKKTKGPKNISKLIDGQFRFHDSTPKLAVNLHNVEPNTQLIITQKLHGCVSGDTTVQTLEYGTVTVESLVKSETFCHIKALNTQTNEIVFAPIKDFYFKENHGEWYEVELENGEKITITGNNPVWMPEESNYKKVEDLKVGEVLLVD